MKCLVRLTALNLCLWTATATEPQVSIAIDDRSSKFAAFYAKATEDHADEAHQWKLWKDMYGFAAVPPTPEGEQTARRMLDQAWPRYASALPRIARGAAVFSPPPGTVLTQVSHLLKADIPIHVRLIAYVGDFDGNAYTAGDEKGQPFTAVPVEVDTGLVMTHEFVHVVNAELAHLSLGWRRTVAHTIFTEGLAMRATQSLHPGQPDKSYTGEFSKDWLARCEQKRQLILEDLKPDLSSDDADAVMKYTMGQGGAGIEREAYYAGWLIVGDMLKRGWSLRAR
jgi:hypothetical protein